MNGKRGKLWQYEEEILKLYNEGWNCAQLAKKYNTKKWTISKWVKRNGLPGFTHIAKDLARKHYLDDNFFEKIDSQEKAYALGIYFSDGDICESLQQVRLGMQDIDVLEQIKDAIKFTGPIYSKIQKSNGKTIYTLAITSKKLKEDVMKLGCVPRKSLILKWPTEVPVSLIRHFIRGLIDGDGCISKYSNTGRYRLQLVGTQEICEGVQKTLGYGTVRRKHPEKNHFEWHVGAKEEVKEILGILYKNMHICMNRKKLLADECLNF